ncbi:MAG TPA: tetratricopeptide repeat protein [Propionibacteriaceae bacterium]|nr:tetratricopeptide repeat protein [Propionibacteriaceae bacterium]
MTTSDFHRSGAVDLSGLTAQAQPVQPGPGASGAAAGAYVLQLDEAGFDAVVRKSLQHPVILELYSPRAHGAQELSDALIELTNAAQGRWLLARVNVDAEQRIAQTLAVQAVPTVVALIGGQVAPLFQGTLPRAEIAAFLEKVMQASVANGIVGRAEPVGPATNEPGELEVDPRFEAADAALEAGDFRAAVAEFDTLLAANPADTAAKLGRANASLLARVSEIDTEALEARIADPTDVDAQLEAADIQLMNGQLELAFDRLVSVVRETVGVDRERARVRLLELFELVGSTDPVVLKARRALSTALF